MIGDELVPKYSSDKHLRLFMDKINIKGLQCSAAIIVSNAVSETALINLNVFSKSNSLTDDWRRACP